MFFKYDYQSAALHYSERNIRVSDTNRIKKSVSLRIQNSNTISATDVDILATFASTINHISELYIR